MSDSETLNKKEAAASATLIEKMRATAEAKAKLKAERAEKAAKEAAEKAEKAAKRAIEKEERAARKAKEEAEKEAAKAERAAARAAKAAEPKRRPGRPRKSDSDSHSVASSSDTATTVSEDAVSVFRTLREPVPKMMLPDLDVPTLAPAPSAMTIEELAAENAALRQTVAKLQELCTRQRLAINNARNLLI